MVPCGATPTTEDVMFLVTPPPPPHTQSRATPGTVLRPSHLKLLGTPLCLCPGKQVVKYI